MDGLTIGLYAIYSGVLLIVAWTDLRTRRVPNWVIGPAMLLAAGAAPWTVGVPAALLGALTTGAPLIFARWLGGAHYMGMGDIKLATWLGLALGWPLALWGLMLGLGLTCLAGLAGIVLQRFTRRSKLPFGPFLAVGCLPLIVSMMVGMP